MWPAAHAPVKACLALLVILAAAFLASEMMESRVWFGFGVVLMLLFQHRFFIPSHFVVNVQGVAAGHAGTMRLMPWHRIRRFHFGKQDGLLSTRVSGRSLGGETIVLFDTNVDAQADSIQVGMRKWSAADARIHDARVDSAS